MQDNTEIKKVFDVLVSILKEVPEMKLKFQEDPANTKAPLESFLERIQEHIEPSLFDKTFFTKIYNTSFTRTYTGPMTRISFFIYKQNNPNYFKFYVDLSNLAREVCGHYKIEQPKGFDIPIIQLWDKELSPELKLHILINNGARPYFHTPSALWYGVITATLLWLLAAILLFVAIIAFISAIIAFGDLVASGPIAIGAGIFLLAGGISGLFFSCIFFDIGKEQLTKAYSDVFDNTTQTNQFFNVSETMDIDTVFTSMEKEAISEEDDLFEERMYRSFK